MSKVTNIVKIEVHYYDKESIMIMEDNYYTFYLPECNRTFLKKSWLKSDIELFNNTFSELDEDIYLVNQKVVLFRITNNVSISNNTEDDMSDYDLSYYLIWEDIKDKLPKFNNKGISSYVLLVIINENWWQSWEGEWDCNVEYIGVIDNDFNPELILTKSSKEVKIKREIELNNYLNQSDIFYH